MHLLGLWLEMAVGKGRSDAGKRRVMLAVFKQADGVGRIGGGGRSGLLD